MAIENAALPEGSLILVTGVNGLIGSHVADQLLLSGYRVRGTVRNLEKNRWIVDFFQQRYGNGLFELVEVPDLTGEDAFKEVIQGTSGVIHVASPVNLDPSPSMIATVVASTLNAVKAADRESSVKRFVLTSSLSAVVFPKPDNHIVITQDSWNEESVRLVENFPAGVSELRKGFLVYMASKVKGEQALWRWVKENPASDLVVNTVLPGGNFGEVLSPEYQGYPSTTGMAAAFYTNDADIINLVIREYEPEYFVDVQDTARLHVAALIHPGVGNERIFAIKTPFNWNVVLAAFRKLSPGRKFHEDDPAIWDELATADEVQKRAEGLLKELGRPDGFTSLEESLKMTVAGL